MKLVVYGTVLLFLGSYQSAQGSKILVYAPRSGYSHVSYAGRLADVLTEAGHDVTVLSIAFNPKLNFTGAKLAKVIRWEKAKPFPNLMDTKSAWEGNGFVGTVKMFLNISDILDEFCEGHLTDDDLISKLRSEKFEFGLCEMFYACAYALFRKIGINNYASIIATNIQEGMTESLGVSNNPSYVPASYSQFMDTMNYRERFVNFMLYLGLRLITRFLWYPNEEKLRKLSPTDISFTDQIGHSSFLFVNSNEFLDFPRLVSQKIVFIGGIAIEQPKPLNEEYKNLMDNATNGAVLISFGTIAKCSEMSPHLKNEFAGAFKALPNLRFLWKCENESDNELKAANIVKKKWIPQNDLLYHPNLRIFITHCGLNSLMESVYAGVPVICIPLFGDQLRNAKIAEKQGISIGLDKNTLSSKTISATIREIMDNKKYKKSAQKLAQMIRGRPFTPRERFLRNIEFALKFGPIRNFDLASKHLNFFQYYLLDIIIPLLVVTLLITYLILRLILSILRKCLKKFNKPKIE